MTRSLAVAAKAVDARSRRSRQRKVGASEIGVCRRRAGYVHHGTPMSNPEHAASLPAIVGTWFHRGALEAMRTEFGYLIETTVEDDLVRGHVDGLDLSTDWRFAVALKDCDPNHDCPEDPAVDDVKTVRDLWMVDYMRNRGPKRSQLFQVHLYADLLRRGKIGSLNGRGLKKSERALHAAMEILKQPGVPIETVRLRYIARTGEDRDEVEWIHEQPYDQSITDEAREWAHQIAVSERPEVLPRDEDGPGLSVLCDHCPFVTECWGEATGTAPQSQLIVTDADLAGALAEYDEARTAEREAKHRKDVAKAKLDATKPAIYTDGDRVAFRLGWSGGNVVTDKIDQPELLARFVQMQELYRKAGLVPPEVPYQPPSHSARTISVTRWEVPDPPCGKPVGPPFAYAEEDGSVWLQDRSRGGWSFGEQTMTAGQWAKAHPDWTDPRPTCVLKKGHSTACADESIIRKLELDGTPPPRADLRLVQGF